MKKAIKIFNCLEDNICGVMLFIMTVLATINVAARYVFLASLPWVEELNKLGLVILTYVGAAVALKKHAHLGLTILTERMPENVEKWVYVFGCLCGLVFCYVGIRYGYKMAMNEYMNNIRTQGMQWPECYFGMWLPIGCGVLAIRFIQGIYYRLRGKKEEDQ